MSDDAAELYLDLMENCLLGTIYKDPPLDPWSGVVKNEKGERIGFGREAATYYIEPGEYDPMKRERGLDWPATAHTMIGQRRLTQLRTACELVLRESIPGDFIETGVWRGGACIMMAAVLKAWQYTTYLWQSPASPESACPVLDGGRRIFVADSFIGLPKPDPKYPADANDWHHVVAPLLAISEEQVRDNFRRYGLLGPNIVFLKGWFKDTLPAAPIEKLAILRLDGDMYEATWDALTSLYSKVSEGGYVIIDDFEAVKGCKDAVLEFRRLNSISEKIIDIDGKGAYWRNSSQGGSK